MTPVLRQMLSLLQGDPNADRVVPPSGYTVWLTVFSAGVMAFLAVFALSLSMATGRIADRWSDELARTSTVRISAPTEQATAQVQAALAILATTPGVAEARALSDDEQRALLEPWFGPNLPVESLPIPRMIEVIEDGAGYDAEGLRQRLAADVPAAVLDDHTRWRQPLVKAASRLRALGWLTLVLIVGATAAFVTLAAQAALSANGQVIRVLRLVGARDFYIARAFVRRFTLRALVGAAGGVAAGLIALLLLPSVKDANAFLSGLGFQGFEWILPLFIPLIAAITAFLATRSAALRALRAMP